MSKRKFSLFIGTGGREAEVQVEADTMREAILLAEEQTHGTVIRGQSHDVVNR